MNIAWIDMHDRDKRVLDWLRKRAAEGTVQANQCEIAEAFSCHRNTARAILRRLSGAGHLREEGRARYGKVYEVVA